MIKLPTLNFTPKAPYMIKGIINEKLSSERIENTFSPQDLVYITQCEKLAILLQASKCMKVIMEDNKEVNVNVDVQSITTGFVEIIKCRNCKLRIGVKKVKTLQLDGCRNSTITLVISDEQYDDIASLNDILSQMKIVSNYNIKNVIFSIETETGKKLKEFTIDIPSLSEMKLDKDMKNSLQFITRFSNNPNRVDLETVVAIREGSGYVSTFEEKEKKDAIQREFEKKMKSMMAPVVRKKSDSSTTTPSTNAVPVPPVPPTTVPVVNIPIIATQENSDSVSSSSFLDQIKNFDKPLNKAETKEKHLIDFIGYGENVGSGKGIGAVTGLAEDVKEYEEEEQVVKQKAELIAKLIKKSKHCCFYTGAGISTSAKIPDYRGPKGCWTLTNSGNANQIKSIDIEQALPTFTHYSISHLVKLGLVKLVVSTNVDGLHRRSGVDTLHLSELHGNCYLEVCKQCKKEYLRGFDVCKTVEDFRDHLTGRSCDDCGGELVDTIVHFNETLPVDELNKAVSHSEQCDLAIVLGTSLLVNPAAQLPTMNKNNQLCIVNLQKTPFDKQSAVRVFSKTDLFMTLLMTELEEIGNIDTSIDALQHN